MGKIFSKTAYEYDRDLLFNFLPPLTPPWQGEDMKSCPLPFSGEG